MAGPLARAVDPQLPAAPQFNAKSLIAFGIVSSSDEPPR
jgi:hypothetical protein